MPKHLVALIQSLYLSDQGVVKVEKTTSDSFGFCKGIRQGCILSPFCLTHMESIIIMRRTLEDWEGGVTVGGAKLTNLRYADDTTLLAANESEMVLLLGRMERICMELGLKINHAKTKLMVVDRSNKIQLTGALSLEFVEDFFYIGANINNTGSCERR